MTVQDLSLSDLSMLQESLMEKWTHGRFNGLDDEELMEVRRRLDLITAEQTRRHEEIFFKS